MTEGLGAISVNHQVGSTLGVRDLTNGGLGQDLSSDIGGGGGRVCGEVFGSDTANMWGGHGGSRDGVGGGRGTNPSRGNVGSWAKDIAAAPIVGIVSTGIGFVGGSNGDSLWFTGGRVIASIRVIISGSN